MVHYCEHDPKEERKLDKKETNSYKKLLITENYYSLNPRVAYRKFLYRYQQVTKQKFILDKEINVVYESCNSSFSTNHKFTMVNVDLKSQGPQSI